MRFHDWSLWTTWFHLQRPIGGASGCSVGAAYPKLKTKEGMGVLHVFPNLRAGKWNAPEKNHSHKQVKPGIELESRGARDGHQQTIILGIKNKFGPGLLVSFSWSPCLLVLVRWSWSPDALVSWSPGLLVLGLLVSWSLGLLVCWSPGLLSYPKPTLNQTTPTLNQPKTNLQTNLETDLAQLLNQP